MVGLWQLEERNTAESLTLAGGIRLNGAYTVLFAYVLRKGFGALKTLTLFILDTDVHQWKPLEDTDHWTSSSWSLTTRVTFAMVQAPTIRVFRWETKARKRRGKESLNFRQLITRLILPCVTRRSSCTNTFVRE